MRMYALPRSLPPVGVTVGRVNARVDDVRTVVERIQIRASLHCTSSRYMTVSLAPEQCHSKQECTVQIAQRAKFVPFYQNQSMKLGDMSDVSSQRSILS